jgi:hypothetical protein
MLDCVPNMLDRRPSSQELAIPLIIGAITALVMANYFESTYEYYFSSDACPPVPFNATAAHRRSLLAGCYVERWTLSDCPLFGHQVHYCASCLDFDALVCTVYPPLLCE